MFAEPPKKPLAASADAPPRRKGAFKLVYLAYFLLAVIVAMLLAVGPLHLLAP
jgi:hypothetical protein